MEGELGAGARIAIALIVIGVIVSVIFVIIGFTRGTTNQGVTTVQNSMGQMSLSQFEDYDQKVLSGTQVNSAIKLFEGQPYGMLVRTKASGVKCYNYGALLAGAVTGTAISGASTYTVASLPVKDSGSSFYVLDYLSTNITYNLVTSPITVTGKETYVRPTGKFIASLIKDATGTITGIAFEQQQ